jgi:hypothetical protein
MGNDLQKQTAPTPRLEERPKMAKHASILGRKAYLGFYVPKTPMIGQSNGSF